MHKRTTQPQAARPTLGFTLIELIVAIGAVAILAVGIASIFGAVGKTVAGGRRVSNLNEYASLIERQMRTDFQAMTRDGVLVIRHEYADVDQDGQINEPQDHVALYPDYPINQQRLRRIDQILFFSKGEFTSSRTPVIPGLNASSSEAMIYYGHGIKLHPLDDYNPSANDEVHYELPEVDDGRKHPQNNSERRLFRNELALGYLDTSNPDTNPNRYAADWTLLRKVTVLATPTSSNQRLPDDQVLDDLGFSSSGPGYIVARDNEIQIAGQPAAASAFRSLAAMFPSGPPGGSGPYAFPSSTEYIRGFGPGGDIARHPTLASGIVDVATTDLAEIRRIITDVGEFPSNIGSELQFFPGTGGVGPLFDDQFDHTSGPAGDIRYMAAWMEDLFPTGPVFPQTTDPEYGARPRYEESFPDFVGLLDTNYPDDPSFPALQSYRIADQRALASSVFVPRCTEFIVEYSFGQIVNNDTLPYHGQLIWFGKERNITIDGNTFPVVYPYPYDTTDSTNEYRPYAMPYQRLDGTTATRNLPTSALYNLFPVPPRDNYPDVLTAHFGYIHPYYTPTDPNVDPAIIPWPWPKLIRITMTLADPVDPSIEQTFQFIFETPETDAF